MLCHEFQSARCVFIVNLIKKFRKNIFKMTILFNFWLLFGIHFIISNVTFCCGAKILGIFPMPGHSHFASIRGVMKSLIDEGHEVSIVSPFARELSKDNYSSIIDISDNLTVYVNTGSYKQYGEEGIYEAMRQTFYYEKNLVDKVFNSEAFKDLMFSGKTSFDVILVEVLAFYKCYLPIAKKLNAPVIGVVTGRSWSIADLATGNPHHPADVPVELMHSWRFDDFYYRLSNWWNYVIIRCLWFFDVVPILEKFHRDHEDELRPYEGYLDIEPDLIFYNGHHSILPRANNPNVVEIGGIQVRPAKPLDQKIQKFIDEADKGVILFTFGSFVKVNSLPADLVNIFLETFASIPQRVIWKFEEPLENVPDNVMISDWLPQRDILEHPNVKAFISHCGLSGIYEAIHTATPIISCPLMFDQMSNAAIVEHLGVAVHLDIDSITKESLLKAINLIINDTKYHDKMQKVSQAFLDRPLSPQQSVVFWTEYILKHRDSLNLMPPSGRLNLFQYYLLDIVSLVVFVSVAFVLLIRWAVKKLFRFFRSRLNLYFQFKDKSV